MGKQVLSSYTQTLLDLLTNGAFSSDISNWVTDTAGGGGSITWDPSGKMKFTQGGTSKWMQASQAIATVVGQQYTITALVDSSTGVGTKVSALDSAYNTLAASATAGAGLVTLSFTAVTTLTYIYLWDGNAPSGISMWDYVTVPAADRLTAEANKITYSNLDSDENVFAYSDLGAGYFGANYSVSFAMRLTAESGTSPVHCAFGLCNYVTNVAEVLSGTSFSGHGIVIYNSTWYLYESMSGAGPYYFQLPALVELNKTYYIRLTRVGSVGTYGRLYLHIYLDPTYTKLMQWGYLDLHENAYFRYVYPISGRTSGGSGKTISGWISDLTFDPYAYSLANIITRVRDIINEDSAVFFADSELTLYANDAERDISVKGGAIQRVEELLSTAAATLTISAEALQSATVLEDYMASLRLRGFAAGFVEYVYPATLGSELCPNNSFATDTTWVKDATWTISSGAAHATNTSTSWQQLTTSGISLTASKKYRVTVKISNWTKGGIGLYLGGQYGKRLYCENGTFSEIFTATSWSGTQLVLFAPAIDTTLDVEWVSVREWTEPTDAVGLNATFHQIAGHWPGLGSAPTNWNQKRGEILIEPPPSTAYPINAYTAQLPEIEMSSLADTPSVAQAFQPLIVLYVVARCCEKMERQADVEFYRALYVSEVEFLRNSIVELIPDLLAMSNYAEYLKRLTNG